MSTKACAKGLSRIPNISPNGNGPLRNNLGTSN